MRQNSGDRGSDGMCLCALVYIILEWYSRHLNSRMGEGDLSLVEGTFHAEGFTKAFYLPVF